MTNPLRSLLSGASSMLGSFASRRAALSPREELIDRIVRVDHAGELAADRIYAGQMAVLKKTASAPLIKKMWEDEKEHLDRMERLAAKHDVRVSIFSPVFSVAGFVLGAASAAVGREGAMACTMAVEQLIGTHYNDQVKELLEKAPEEKEILDTLTKMRDEELHHFDVGKEHDGEKAPLFGPMKTVVQAGCKAAIAVAERI